MAWKYGYVPLERLLDWIREHPLGDGRFVPVCMWGARGTAKTASVKAYADSRELGLRILQPAQIQHGADLVGIARVDEETNRTTHAMPDRLPIEGDCEPQGVLFIDEVNRTQIEVLQGLMQVIGEGEISQSGWKLPAGWMIVCAANPNIPGYEVTPLDEAFLGRMLHIPSPANLANWSRYADDSGLSRRVVDFMLQNRDLVDLGDSDLPVEVRPSLSLRSGEYLARLYDPQMDLALLDLIARGLWGEDAAEALIDHHNDPATPMSGPEVLAGRFDAVLSHWIAEQRHDLVRASTERMIAFLQARPPARSKATQSAARYLSQLPDSLLREAVVSFSESAPGWLTVILSHEEFDVASRIPRGAALRRMRDRDLSAERESRLEIRRLSERAAGAGKGSQLELPAADLAGLD